MGGAGAGNGSVLRLHVFQTINTVSRNNKQHDLGRRGQEDLVLQLLSSHLSRNSLDYLIFLQESILDGDVVRPGATECGWTPGAAPGTEEVSLE